MSIIANEYVINKTSHLTYFRIFWGKIINSRHNKYVSRIHDSKSNSGNLKFNFQISIKVVRIPKAYTNIKKMMFSFIGAIKCLMIFIREFISFPLLVKYCFVGYSQR